MGCDVSDLSEVRELRNNKEMEIGKELDVNGARALDDSAGLLNHYNVIRAQTERLAEGLSTEDLSAQSMPDASPGKWHLAHTSWFFETFILQKYSEHYRCINSIYAELFNSYYESVGKRHARPQRGLITRPSMEEVFSYRRRVDEAMVDLLEASKGASFANEISSILTIGLHHEMQHQELFLTDILHLLSHNPMHPAIKPEAMDRNTKVGEPSAVAWKVFEGGQCEIGATSNTSSSEPTNHWKTFSYDCERPKHIAYLQPYSLADRTVTNKEWLEFIEDGGYETPLLWLSDGWAARQKNDWYAPLYWRQQDDQWFQFTVNGMQVLELDAPVCHISYYEADAYARWAGKRLPSEQEWEHAARKQFGENIPEKTNFLEQLAWKALQNLQGDFSNLYGDVWEWTQSAYTPYPGFKSEQGALGEYNGKFMINQCVLKGGSCATPRLQMRPSYRNFFYPHHRWQFSGVRLAGDNS